MTWLILGIERYDGTDQIDVTVDVHVKVSQCGVIIENHAIFISAIEKDQI
jgi:hypothetical protein